MADPLVRRNVWELGDDDWPDPLLWYARAVGAMKNRAFTDRTSWRYYAAIHGVRADRWREVGFLQPGEAVPDTAADRDYFLQCQHQSWYFLPWHRGYVLAFEAVVRAAVDELKGPAGWTLPYWNYFKDGQNRLPAAFASAKWPDGDDDNPLFVPERWGPNHDGDVFVQLSAVNMNALNDGQFVGVASGGAIGFGGPQTEFNHGGGASGGIESQPHNRVHTQVGGASPDGSVNGVMSDPSTAGLDPIFWLHHANIDRLWETWRTTPAGVHRDPTDLDWLKGPERIGQRAFVMPRPDGTQWTYTPEDVTSLSTLGYGYDDLDADGVPEPVDRLALLAGAPAPANAEVSTVADDVELVGANDQPLTVSGTRVDTSVRLDPPTREKVNRSLARVAEDAAPDRLFLNVENVRGLSDATDLDVYVGPPGEDPERPNLLAGGISLFGVRNATETDGDHAGQGLTFVLEITGIVDELYLERGFDVDDLDVCLVAAHPVPDAARISIGRVSVYRQGTGTR